MFHADEEVIEASGPRGTVDEADIRLRAEHDVGEEVASEMPVRGGVDSSLRVRKLAATIIRPRISLSSRPNTKDMPDQAMRGVVIGLVLATPFWLAVALVISLALW